MNNTLPGAAILAGITIALVSCSPSPTVRELPVPPSPTPATTPRPVPETTPGEHPSAETPRSTDAGGILFSESFETGDWRSHFSKCAENSKALEAISKAGGPPILQLDDSIAADGNSSLKTNCIRFVPVGTSGQAYQKFFPKPCDELFLRWFFRLDKAAFLPGVRGKGCALYARSAELQKKGADAGNVADGTNKFSARLSWEDEPNSNRKYWVLYFYHPEQKGDFGDKRRENVGPRAYLEPDKWQCLELQLRANTPGQRDGVIRFWVDGVLRGEWTDLRLRDTADLKITEAEILHQFGVNPDAPTKPNDSFTGFFQWTDAFVVSNHRVGPLAEGTGSAADDPTKPSQP